MAVGWASISPTGAALLSALLLAQLAYFSYNGAEKTLVSGLLEACDPRWEAGHKLEQNAES